MPEDTLFERTYLNPTTIIIGMTGPLSSGCSTIAEHLAALQNYKFEICRLSDIIRAELRAEGIVNPSSEDLQNKGNEMRRAQGNDILVKICIRNCLGKVVRPERIVIDGIRNPGEVHYLRNFSRFFLVAIDAKFDTRLKRFREKTGNQIPDTEFRKIDDRDSGKNEPLFGQNVRECVDLADYQILNEDSWERSLEIKRILFDKVYELLQLIYDPGSGIPSLKEIGMHLAYSASLLSNCLKRKVGAAIAKEIKDEEKEIIIALGYNHTPGNIRSCMTDYGDCYRDVQKEKMKESMKHEIDRLCPDGAAENIFNILFAEKGLKRLDFCRAVHAEESAILQVAKLGGSSLEGTTLYTSTFPCLLCAKKIIESGIARIVYNEPYPVEEARQMLEENLGEDNIIRFEGAKSVAFFKLFRQS